MTNLLVVVPNMSACARSQLHDRLRAAFPELTITAVGSFAEAEAHIGTAEILMAYNIPDPLAAGAGKLKWVQSLASGTDGFLSRPSLPQSAMITRMQNVAPAPVSEGVVALMLALARRFPAFQRAQAERRWDREASWTATMVAGRTAGILGIGQIAEMLAPKLKALGMTVIGVSSRDKVAGFDRILPYAELIAAAPDFDFLIALTPLKAETRHLVDASVLAALKPSAFLVNVSRGELLDEDALIAALQSGRLAGAGLDVFATEPLPAESALWELPNVIIVPHATATHAGYIDDIFPLLELNMRRYLDGDIDGMQYIIRRGAVTQQV